MLAHILEHFCLKGLIHLRPIHPCGRFTVPVFHRGSVIFKGISILRNLIWNTLTLCSSLWLNLPVTEGEGEVVQVGNVQWTNIRAANSTRIGESIPVMICLASTCQNQLLSLNLIVIVMVAIKFDSPKLEQNCTREFIWSYYSPCGMLMVNLPQGVCGIKWSSMKYS